MSTPAHAPHRFLALGDSYTIGEGVPEAGRWPVQLARALRAEGIALADPDIVATTGWTTDELAAGIDAAAPVGDYALVSLQVGVNNQYRGRPLDEFRAQFAELLQRAVALAGDVPGRVLVLAIPDWGVTPFGAASGRDTDEIARALDAFNAAAAQQAHLAGARFVDIAPISRAHGGKAPMLTDDGLHPSAALYTQWAEHVLPVARRILANTGS